MSLWQPHQSVSWLSTMMPGRRVSPSGPARRYAVEVAGDGDTGLALQATRAFDVLMVDHQMPGTGGLDVLRTLATRRAAAHDHGDGAWDEAAVEAMKLGAGDYLVKDVEGRYLTLLPTVVARVLHQQRLLEEKQQAEAALQQTLAALETRVRERTAALRRPPMPNCTRNCRAPAGRGGPGAAQRRHTLILDSAGEGIYGIDLEGRTTFVNLAAARMLGWEVEALLVSLSRILCATRWAMDSFLRHVPDPRLVSEWCGPACARGRILARTARTSWSNTSARRCVSTTCWWVQ